MIHIVTLNWNGLEKLQELYASLLPAVEKMAIVDHGWKWYVRDNGSTDGSKEWLAELPNVELLSVDHNRDTFAQGMNSLFALVRESIDPNDVILFLNNDVVIEDLDSLLKMYWLLDHHTYHIGIVGARLLYKGTNRLQHAGVIFGPRYGNMPYHYRHKEVSDAAAEKNRFFQAVTAACCMISWEVFMDVGDMDEKFAWAFDDIDYCLQAGQKGHLIAYCGETKIYHEESASLKKNPVNKLFLSRNVKHFKKKWGGGFGIDHEKYLKDPDFNLLKVDWGAG
jgi:GT2 family glycosyltransferase